MDQKGNLYAHSNKDRLLFCYDHFGEKLWQCRCYETVEAVEVGSDGTVYLLLNGLTLATYDPKIAVLSKLRSFPMPVKSMKLDRQDALYCSCENGKLYCFKKHQEGWIKSIGIALSCLDVDSKNRLYGGSDEGLLYCFDADHAKTYCLPTDAPIQTLVIDSKDNFYFTTKHTHGLYYFDQKRSLLRKSPVKTSASIASLALLQDTIYFCSPHKVYYLPFRDYMFKSWEKVPFEETAHKLIANPSHHLPPKNALDPLFDQCAHLQTTFSTCEAFLDRVEEDFSYHKELLEKEYALTYKILPQKLDFLEIAHLSFAKVPFFDCEGRCYFLTKKGTLYCYEGDELLSVQENIPVDGQAITTTRSGHFIASGDDLIQILPKKTRTFYRGKPDSNPIMDPHENVYFVEKSALCCMLRAHLCCPTWRYPLQAPLIGNPISDAEERTYFGTKASFLRCLDSEGLQQWENRLPSPLVANTLVESDGKIFFATQEGTIFCFSSDGISCWTYPSGAKVTSPLLLSSSRIYFINEERTLMCLQKNGDFLWAYPSKEGKITLPAVDLQETCYFGTSTGHLCCVDQMGQRLWRYPMGAKILQSPFMDSKRRLFVLLSNHALFLVPLTKPQ